MRRRWVSGIALLAILFAQLAAAAYACPALRPADRDAPVAMASESMPCAGLMADDAVQGVDPEQAALCLEHCKSSAKTVDSGHAPTIAPAPLFVVIVPRIDGDRSSGPSWSAHERERDEAPPPSHSIVHCCWRI